MKIDNFFAELKRRNVYKVAVAYIIAGWALSQGVAQVFPVFDVPNWAIRVIVLLIIIGLPIAVVLAWMFEITPQGIKRTEIADAMPAVARQKKHAWIYVVVIGGTISIALFFLGRYTSSKQSGGGELPAKSIAVLPFENLSRDLDNAYFTEGVQEEILTRLAKIADLKVISRTSTQHFKSTPDNLPQIAKQLGVTNILEGSVQKAADQVRVNVQLINAANDAHLWAESFDRKLTDIFAVESDIATTIAETLQAKLTGSEKAAIAKRPTANPEAYELYLKGRFFWNKRTGAGLRKAIEYFNQALGKDPSYSLAYAGLADSYNLLPAYGAASPADSFPQAKAAAKKALELDDTLAEAHTSLALVLAWYDFDFEQALKEFERAVQLNPNYATAHQWYASGPLSALGQSDRAIAEGKRAVELDPLSLIINADLGCDYFFARRYDEAITQLRKTIEMDPRFYYAHWNLGQVWQLKGQLSEAIAEYRKALELNDDPFVLALLGQAYVRAGQREEAQKILAQLSEQAKSRYVHAYSFALMFLALGDKERAIDEMERAYRERASNDVAFIKVDPLLDPLRGNPRFEALAEKIVPKREFGNAATGK
jgi:TolB-like protein/Tfp pilus assembly protein PilF